MAIRIPRPRRGGACPSRRPAPMSDNGTSRAPSPTQKTKVLVSLRTSAAALVWQSVPPSPVGADALGGPPPLFTFHSSLFATPVPKKENGFPRRCAHRLGMTELCSVHSTAQTRVSHKRISIRAAQRHTAIIHYSFFIFHSSPVPSVGAIHESPADLRPDPTDGRAMLGPTVVAIRIPRLP